MDGDRHKLHGGDLAEFEKKQHMSRFSSPIICGQKVIFEDLGSFTKKFQEILRTSINAIAKIISKSLMFPTEKSASCEATENNFT